MADADALNTLIFLANPANTTVAAQLLDREGMEHFICQDLELLLEKAAEGVGVLLLDEERLRHHRPELTDLLNNQPPWSEPPVILVTGKQRQSAEDTLLESLPNITLLERPISSVALISHLHAGRRSRRRQYQLRDLLENLQRTRLGLEQQVTERTAEAERRRREAERSNRDLQHFASAVSHDLREPLLVIARYLQLLEKRSRDRLDPGSREMISQMQVSIDRLQAMIKGVLTYSRLGRAALKSELFDAAEAVSLACANLEVSIADTATAITHDRHLPRVRADKLQLTQLFQNLISNAQKFVREDRPRVHVSSEHQPDGWLFRVRDNGIGIDPTQHQNIFRMFNRAHQKERYAGTGIGLAVCKQIVERHGGRIWVESALGEGACFCFTLPDRLLRED